AVLISSACETGALCGAPRYRSALARYGELLGMAFQIADDILDYTSDSTVTGKPSGLDLREHKVTLPLILALPQLVGAGRTRVEELFATEEPDDQLISDVVAIVADAGGIERAHQCGERFAREAEESLAPLPDTSVRSSLTDAISYVMDRRS
ncbi:MAG TPA: polyprenyl synthetase family protein, partial [Gemmatimonadaceae bacterium]|nr:polyprenyl synthetase family protein [Gemmatimonadaceae bacterium]